MRNVGIGLFVFVLFTISQVSVTAVGQSVRVMTYNIGYTTVDQGLNPARCGSHLEKQVQDSKDKVMKIANYLKNKGIEVALFQEILKRCGAYEEWTGLDEALDSIGYPMDIALSNSERPNHVGMHTLIVSKYPIVQPEVQTHPLTAYGDAFRWYVMAPVLTDVGKVSFYSVHTRWSRSCLGLIDFFNRGLVDGNERRIIGGDFNMEFTRYPTDWYKRFQNCQIGDAGPPLKVKVDAYTAVPNTGGDFILLPKDQPFAFTKIIIDGESGILTDHFPVITDISLNLQPKTTPEKAGDADRDGDVDIFDFNTILQYFGKSECSVNVVKECTIDIFDYNEVVAKM